MRTVLCPVVVGRDAELAAVEDALERTRSGRGTSVVVVGEAGLGKSRLLREAQARAVSKGMVAWSGRAVAGGSPVAYRPVIEAIAGGMRGSKPPSTPDLRPFRTVLARLVPEWAGEADQPSELSPVLLAEGLLRLLRHLAGGAGAALLLDDLQWADPETLAVVEYLADNIGAEPVTCVWAARDEPAPAASLARQLESRGAAVVQRLTPLRDVDVDTMVEAILGTAHPSHGTTDELTPLLRRRSDGVPLLVEDLLTALTGSGRLVQGDDGWAVHGRLEALVPDRFRDTVHQRLRRLPAHQQQVLQAAAVLGAEFAWSLLPVAAGADEAVALEALRAAIDAQLIVAEPQGFRFRHALTRDAVLQTLLPPERRRVARAALSALRADRPELDGERCALAADLAVMADDPGEAFGLLFETGRRALAQGALASAESAFERARELAGDDPARRADAEEQLVEVLILAGRPDPAREAGRSRLSSLTATGADSGRLAAAHLQLARVAISATRWRDAGDHLDTAGRLAADDDASLARVAAARALVAMGDRQPEAAGEAADDALARAERVGLPEVACQALEVQGRAARVRDLDAAWAAFGRARAVAEEHGLAPWRIRALHELGTVELLRDGRDDLLLTARELASDAGVLSTVATLDVQLAALYAGRFEPVKGLEVARRAEDAARRYGLGLLLPTALLWQAAAHALTGHAQKMEAALEEALTLAGGDVDVVAGSWGACRAMRSLLAEERARAREELDTAMTVLDRSPAPAPFLFQGLWALLRTLSDDEGAAARQRVRREEPANAGNAALLDLADAVDLGRAGRPDDARAVAARGDEALAVWGGLRHLARRLAAEAAVADGWGQPAEWLTEAAGYFERSGHDRVVSACRGLLRRAGVRLPRRGVGATEVPAELRALGITRRETEVLDLVAEGLSNTEIGERLYLSPRTVEKHVASLMMKTQLPTRRRLVAFGATRPAPDTA